MIELNEMEKRQVREGHPVGTMRDVYVRVGCSLKEAKEAINAYREEWEKKRTSRRANEQ